MKIEKKIFTQRDRIIDSFYKEFFTWSAGTIGTWITAGIVELIASILFCIPYQEMTRENIWIILLVLALCGVGCYLLPYKRFQEFGKNVSIFEKLQYLPVSRKELQNYCLKKLFVFCTKMFFVFLAAQVFFTLVTTHRIALENVMYVVICGGLVPFIGTALTVKTSK